MNWLAFLGGFAVVLAGMISEYVTGTWTVLELGIAGLIFVLVMIVLNTSSRAPRAAGHRSTRSRGRGSRRAGTSRRRG